VVPDGVLSFPAAADVSGARRVDPCFTIYTARLAVKAAVEASHELRRPARMPLSAAYDGLRVRFRAPPQANVVRHSADHDPELELALPSPEALLLLHPHYVADLLRVDAPTRAVTTAHETMLTNAQANTAAGGGPPAAQLRMACLAHMDRSTGAHSADVHALLLLALRESAVDVWGGMAAGGAGPQSPPPDNDLALNAMPYLTFVGCFAGMHVSGGVAQSGFYYMPMGVRGHATTYLPRAWSGVVVTTHDRVTHNIVNRLMYEDPAPTPTPPPPALPAPRPSPPAPPARAGGARPAARATARRPGAAPLPGCSRCPRPDGSRPDGSRPAARRATGTPGASPPWRPRRARTPRGTPPRAAPRPSPRRTARAAGR
jgi:hypothetical protein